MSSQCWSDAEGVNGASGRKGVNVTVPPPIARSNGDVGAWSIVRWRLALRSSPQNAASTARWLTPASSSRPHRIRSATASNSPVRSIPRYPGSSVFTVSGTPGRVQGRERVGRAVGVEVDEVRAEAHVEGHRLVGEAAHELRVVDGPDAVIDAVDVQQVERVADAVGARRLPGVRRAPETELAGAPVRRREPWSGAARAGLVAVDRQPDDPSRAGRSHPLDERLGLVAGLGAQDRQQQVARRQPLGLGSFEPGGQGVGERPQLPPGPVGRVDDDLGVDDAVGAGPCGVVVGHLGGEFAASGSARTSSRGSRGTTTGRRT